MLALDDKSNKKFFSLRNVFFEISDIQIIRNISVDISPKKITGIIGPSGAGKSTFLRLLNKLIIPTRGIITFRNENLNNIPAQQIRKRVGMVQQQAYLFNGTVKDNLLYGPNIWNIEYSDNELNLLLRKVALDESFLFRDIEGLSGGEQQRVSLARSLANKPQVLLLDEPTSSLDINSEEIIENTLKVLMNEGIDIVIITHSLEQTERITDSIIFLKEGQLIENMPTHDFFSKYNKDEIKMFFKAKEENKK